MAKRGRRYVQGIKLLRSLDVTHNIHHDIPLAVMYLAKGGASCHYFGGYKRWFLVFPRAGS